MSRKDVSVLINTEWNGKYGGSENVNISLGTMFIKSPKFLTLWNENQQIQNYSESFLSNIKFLPKKILGLLSIIVQVRKVRRNTVLLINSSFMFAHWRRIRGSNKRHVVYLHTPIRYLWSPEVDQRVKLSDFGVVFVSSLLKKLDKRFVNREALFIANSSTVAKRALDFWGIRPKVIHPPVDVAFFGQYFRAEGESNYLIAAGRLVGYKGFCSAIDLAAEMGITLVIAGAGPDEAQLRSRAKDLNAKVIFVISPSREELAVLLAGAAVLLHIGIEDFGILPVEAMATGTPVVGLSSGGLLDSVTSKSGILVNDLSDLHLAVMSAKLLVRSEVRDNSLRFSETTFRSMMCKEILDQWPECEYFFDKKLSDSIK